MRRAGNGWPRSGCWCAERQRNTWAVEGGSSAWAHERSGSVKLLALGEAVLTAPTYAYVVASPTVDGVIT